ncbi:aldehyde dehydrogenase family protein [Streptomyces sp. ISID311]|uniref:aldehyde dehydrogenase family protein n=1 Tax=Streptomyces sp. ISID311 TaxID=2601673 RepID=UPI0011BD3470|nr:aldehyde dehydrogenase family protein [Streptomyces sp. ISID311]TXC99899.1 aldehyde dehydrogenase family protein [Streptomyces sp. ISID311]
MTRAQLLIGGEWTDSVTGRTAETVNPATGEVIGTFAEASPVDIAAAVDAGRAGFESNRWQSMSPDERGRILWRIADLVERHASELAALETMDQGQPTTVSTTVNVPLVAQTFRYYAGWATKLKGKLSPVSVPDQLTYQRRAPLGVCGLITPWNFPLAIAGWKLAPALATGNAVVLKPAEQTPLSTVRLVELVLEAGIPPGVVNLVTGGPDAGKALVAHPRVDMVSFTGSTAVGQEIVRTCSGTLKRVSLELGGKAPSIVAPDADMQMAVVGNLRGALFNTGQACGAFTRFFVHRSKAEEFVSRLATAADSLRIGPGSDPETVVGPLVSAEHLDRVASYVALGEQQGAVRINGGERVGGAFGRGFFYRPTVFADVTDDMTIARDEIFGPVMCVMPYDDLDEAVARANNTDYGLAAAIWTQDLRTAHTLAPRIRAGTVFVNQIPIIDPGAPWGGFGLSGWGREMGSYALDEFTETQSVFVNLS